MSKLYEAIVIDIDKSVSTKEGAYNSMIKIKPVGASVPAGDRLAYPPSFMPFSRTGGGVTSMPPKEARCIVLRRDYSEYDQILTYIPQEATGPEGVYVPEEAPEGAVDLKVGGKVKSLLRIAPQGEMGFYTDAQAYLKMYGGSKHIDTASNTWHTRLGCGLLDIAFSDKHPTTGKKEIGEYKFIYSKAYEALTSSDYDQETEAVSAIAATATYTDKVVVRAGTIYNYDSGLLSRKEDVGHVYQIESRQNTITAKEKDTVSVLRIGYQRANNVKYNNSTQYSAGTILEWSAKRVNPVIGLGDYSSFLMRYGKLESDTKGSQAEQTAGEVYRLQVYDKVFDPIGTPVVDPVGEGKGYKYELFNKLATQQFTQSFGALSDKTFYREHIHSFPGLSSATKNMYSGISYDKIIGGESMVKEQLIYWGDSKKVQVFNKTMTKRLFEYKSSQYDSDTEKTYESIQMGADNFSIELKVDDKTKYIIKFAAGSMKITLDTGDAKTTSSVELKKEGKITINPGSGKTAGSIYIGGADYGQQLVTKSWLDMVFANHIHPTTGPGAPTLPPTPIPVVSGPTPTSHTTFITKVE